MFKNKAKKAVRGFTLIEILIVIGIIAILAAIVIVAINPAKQFAQARNAQRQSSVNTILNAVGQRMADNKGTFAGSFTVAGVDYTCGPLPGSATTVVTDMAADTTTATGALGCLVPTYVSSLPFDPQTGAGVSTGYTVVASTTGRVTVCAPAAAAETAVPNPGPICVTR